MHFVNLQVFFIYDILVMVGDNLIMNDNIIEIDLDSKEEYINKYDDKLINDDLHDYVIKRAMEIKNNSDIIIRIHFNYAASVDEKRLVRNFIVNDINNNLKIKSSERINFKDIYLALIGIGCLIISIMFSYLKMGVVSEIFIIVGWVCIWEIVNDFLFIDGEVRLKRKKYLQLSKAKIEFY